ncbi:hypothetical protein [Sinosporangium siamense]|uniref:Bifunctional folylpolyglutamate synthase/dihydrofolate synthase n=1 Tax=Sinosporangium siamense TaxID=1367973 RepID=A0A919RQ71_9ACTN|nr:hypothetical protein [Sinosporangium siamense]GII97257.1 bifunctional folylpolyglutamate synthase/dihydrofolate synthase [Sinosporangium siamense]
MTLDAVFFDEWRTRGDGERRSLERARALVKILGLDVDNAIPVLSIVGSKGKGTTATYASAVLSAAGLRVVTVTGPALRDNRERIRVNGAAVDDATFRDLARQLAGARQHLPNRDDEPGYLAPSGLFTIAGVLHARQIKADVLVLEAGMGGRSDEAAIFPPTVLAVAEIFGEHLGILGETVPDIAREKVGLADHHTEAVVSLPQNPGVLLAMRETSPVDVEVLDPASPEPTGPLSFPAELLPIGLSGQNAVLGHTAALRLLSRRGLRVPTANSLSGTLQTVILPGRLSLHRIDSGTHLLVDSAVNQTGAATARCHAETLWPRIDHVLVCMPDHKDLEGVVAALGGLPITYVRLPFSRLGFSRSGDRPIVDAERLTPGYISSLGTYVLAIGTVYFAGVVLDTVDALTERLFVPPNEA